MKNLKFFFYGIIVGIFELIPGISGSTILYLLNIYERLIFSISNINYTIIKSILFNLFNLKKLNQIFKKNDFYFLLIYAIGMFTSVLTFSKLIDFLLQNYEKIILTIFLIIIFFSILFFLKNFKFKIENTPLLFCGILFVILLNSFSVNISLNYFSLFFLGIFISIFGILPGVSGSQMLLVLGVYNELIKIISDFEILKILIFCFGGIFGIFFSVFFIKKLFQKYELKTLTAILGMIFGSLIVLTKNIIF